jgi:hypothetical protein
VPRDGQTDTQQIAAFKGMATAGGYYGADPSYLQSLTNAYVTQEGTLRRRAGSAFIYGLSSASLSPEVFQFAFQGFKWLLHRNGAGTGFEVYRVLETNGTPYSIDLFCSKANVLRTASASEPATYAVYTDGDYCHVLVATASTQLVSITLTARELLFATLPTSTTATARVTQWLTGNNTSNTNSKLLLDATTSFSATTAISNSSETYTFTWSTRPGSVAINSGARLFQCFWLRYTDATYYPGNALYDSAVRRNSVPLDVNVQLPENIGSNPIYNEPIQDLDYETYRVYDGNTSGVSPLTKVTNKQPLVNNQWDFSDGSYRAINTQLCNRTAKYVSFGGLNSGGNINTRIYVARLRTILVGGFSYPSISDMEQIIDKLVVGFNVWHSFNGTQVVSGEPKYFSRTATMASPPGVDPDAVMELVYKLNAAGTGASTSVFVDISRDRDSHTISDGSMVPLYGYNLLTKTKNFKFPNVVRVVGKRLVLCGSNSNLILVSSSDWNYRGFQFTNLQVSALNYNENSPYLINLGQNTSSIFDVSSVNGVMVVCTDVGVFTVGGNERTSPPNAVTTNVARLTDQVFRQNCTLVIDNTVYMANSAGLFKLNYIRETDRNLLEPLSLPVAGLFAAAPLTLTYSANNESILVKREGRPKLLAFNMRSETWSYVQVAVPNEMLLFPSLDGFVFATGSTHVVCVFDDDQTTDLVNISFLGSFTFAANTASVTTTPSLPTNLVSPPELVGTYLTSGTAVVPAYDAQLRSVDGTSVLTETTAGNAVKPILASAVTKAIYADKLQRGQRLREVLVLLRRSGTARVVFSNIGNDTGNQLPQVHTLTIASDGSYSVAGDKQQNVPSFTAGDTIAFRLSGVGVSEAFVVGVDFGSTELAGYQPNTTAKSLSRLT